MKSFAGGILWKSCLVRMTLLAGVLTAVQAGVVGQGWDRSSRPGGESVRRLHNVPAVAWQQVPLVPVPDSVAPWLTPGADGASMDNVPQPLPPVRVPEGGSMLVMLGLGTAGILGLAKWMTHRHPLPPPTPMEGELSPPGS